LYKSNQITIRKKAFLVVIFTQEFNFKPKDY